MSDAAAEVRASGGAGAGAALRPTRAEERLEAIDALRGVALLGIVLMNIPYAGLATGDVWDPVVAGGHTGADWWAWFLSAVLVDGKARAVFSTLFGAGVILMTDRAKPAHGEAPVRIADIYYRRMLWLMAFGLADAYLLVWTGDIIWLYGLCGLVLFPLRGLSSRALIGAGVALVGLSVCFGLVERAGDIERRGEVVSIRATLAAGGTISEEQRETLREWDTEVERPDAEEMAESLEVARSGYLRHVIENAPVVTKLQSGPLYLEFDALSMMLLGMGLMRARVITGERGVRLYALLAGVCLPLGWAVAALGPLDWSGSGFDRESVGSWWTAWEWTYPVQRLLLAVGYMAIVMLACRVGALRPLRRAAAAAGRMPLTNYLGQSAIYLVMFTGVGFAMVREWSRSELMLVALAIWVAQALLSLVWARFFAFGPMEFVWRWLSYRRRPAWRRVAGG